MHSEFQKYNPFRRPEWRFDRVLELVEHRPDPLRPSRLYDDQYIKLYRNFLLLWKSKQTNAERLRMFPKNPALYYAHLLHHHPDKEWRSIIEARLLARETDEEIAEHMHTMPMAIYYYEKLFYNVRDRINNYTYIVKTVLGPETQRAANREGTFTPHQRDLCWKLFAYHGQSAVLDLMISGFNRLMAIPTSVERVNEWFDYTFETTVRRKSVIAGRTLEVNRYNVMTLLSIHVQLLESQRQANAQAGPKTEIHQNVEEFLHQIPWALGQSQTEGLNPLQQKYHMTAFEPRADHAFMIASGQDIENGDAQAAMRLREPVEKQNEHPIQQGS